MTQREWIYIGGAVGAILILKSAQKPGAKGPLASLANKVLPKQQPRPTTTNLATGYGTRTVPVGPTSGIGFNPRTGAPAGSRQAPLTPVQAGIGAGISTLGAVLNRILGRPSTTKPPTSATQPRSQGSAPTSQGGGGTGGTVGGQGTTGRPGGVSNGGFMANSPTPYGFYDGGGNWVATDINGNIAPDSTGNYPGYYNESGGYTPYLGTATSSPGGGLQAQIPNLGGDSGGLIADAIGDGSGWNEPALESGYDVGTGWVDYETGDYFDYNTGQWSSSDQPVNVPAEPAQVEPPQGTDDGGGYYDEGGNYTVPDVTPVDAGGNYDPSVGYGDDGYGYDDGSGYTDYESGEYYDYGVAGGDAGDISTQPDGGGLGGWGE